MRVDVNSTRAKALITQKAYVHSTAKALDIKHADSGHVGIPENTDPGGMRVLRVLSMILFAQRGSRRPWAFRVLIHES